MADSLGLYLPAAVAYRLIGLVRGVVLTWVLSAAEFGLFQIALVAVNVLMPLAGLGLHEAMSRYVPQYEARHALRAFLRRAWRFSLGVSVLVCAAGMVFASPLTRLIFGTSYGASAAETAGRVGLTRWTIGGVFVLIVFMLLLAVLKGLRMFLAVSLLEMVGGVLFTGLAVVLPLCGWADAEAVMFAVVAAYGVMILLVGLPFMWHVRKLINQSEPVEASEQPPAVWAQMLRFSVWSALAAMLMQVTQFCPMWYLQKTHGSEVTAVFGSVRLVTQAVLIAATSVIVVVQATVTRTWESQGREAADRQLMLAFKVTGLLMLAGCAVLAAGAPLVIRMFPRDYATGVAIFPLLLAFFMVCGHLAFLVVHFILIERSLYICVLWLVGAVTSQGFAQWLIQPGAGPDQAMRSAAWASILSISFAFGAALYWMRKERWPLDRGSVLLIAASFSLVLPGYALAATVGVVAILVLATGFVLSGEEKGQIRTAALGWMGRVVRRLQNKSA